MATGHNSLSGADYSSESVFKRERDRILHRSWYYVARADPLSPGDRLVANVAGESVLIVCDRDGTLYAHANVCRHRGAQLCAESGPGPKSSISCPYHAFSYALDGRLIGTPNVGPDEIDRDSLSLWSIALEVWQGFIFVNLSENPPTLLEWFDMHPEASLLPFAHHNMGELRVGRRTVAEVNANWKIIFDNYMECLHCPQVHPELVGIVPLYRSGAVVDESRDDGGVSLLAGSSGFSPEGRSVMPLLPTMTPEAAETYFGMAHFPNMFLDVTGTCIMATALHPTSATHTTMITEYLFAADVVADPNFDPSDVVDFNELVGHQDYVVCAIVQRGVESKYFTHGVLADKDSMIANINERYLAERDG
jgi:Rieske 2Fe-2S family protein